MVSSVLHAVETSVKAVLAYHAEAEQEHGENELMASSQIDLENRHAGHCKGQVEENEDGIDRHIDSDSRQTAKSGCGRQIWWL